uniref:DUF1579 domain-containing protein n=1 Tax=Schlesneria paludicola TaxID=360056 RepID=A0A7C2K197_9PLAN
MLRSAMAGMVAVLGFVGAAFGQGFSQPGPEHKRLQEFVGTWDAVMTFGDQKSQATSTYRAICGGMWVESDYEGMLGEVKFSGRGIDGYDQQKKKYVGLWVDSVSSAPLRMEGDYNPETKQLVMTGESRGPDGQPQKFKAVTETRDKDHFTFRMYMLPPNGEDQLAFTIEYTRKK